MITSAHLRELDLRDRALIGLPLHQEGTILTRRVVLEAAEPSSMPLFRANAPGGEMRTNGLLVTVLALGFSSNLRAADLPNRLGQCVETSIKEIADRFGGKLSPLPPEDGFDPGTTITYANGGYQVSYYKETVIVRSKIGDKVKMCLVEIPKNCPPGDDRGRVYNTKNLRTGEAWSLPDAQHECGGP